MNWIKAIAVLFIALTGIALFIYHHEIIHKQIYSFYGSEAKINWFKNFYTAETIGTCKDENCIYLQAQTEMIGNTALALIANAWLIFICFMICGIKELTFFTNLTNLTKHTNDTIVTNDSENIENDCKECNDCSVKLHIKTEEKPEIKEEK